MLEVCNLSPALSARLKLAAPLALALLAPLAPSARQARPAPDSALLRELLAIRAIDNHAHVVRPVPDDRDYDALPFSLLDPPPAGALPGPAYLRPDYPMFVRAWKALYGYPHMDASAAHLKEVPALKQRAMKEHGAAYPAWVLDRQGIDIILANRVEMGSELQGRRFRWVPYADALLFPLDNSIAKAANRDYAAFYPAEETLLKRYLTESGIRALPATLADYCRSVVSATLERHKTAGAVAEKLEMAYLRSLDVEPAAEPDAARVYAQFVSGGVPPARDYKTLQDYLFSYLAREAGRLDLAIHIHVANGGGANYDQRGSQPLLLTWAFNEPALRKTNFVVVHGGYPFYRDTAGLMSKPNVYADFSALSYFEGMRGQADLLRGWMSQWPEKILFGTDASPDTDEIGWEETGWVASQTAREALALALTGMIQDGEISRARASELARMVLHDNAAGLYRIR
jgi:predicted TIM-barrel fold metal-dependent hydrolase